MHYTLSDTEIQTYLKYAKQNLPRHTSYPAAPYWEKDFSIEKVKIALQGLQKTQHPLSLYFHIPYCRQLCFYCGCTKEIYPEERQKKCDPRGPLLEGLFKEIRNYAKYLKGNSVHQIHLGGGTPTFLHPDQLRQLFEVISSEFSIAEDAEIAVEIDPRVTTYEHLQVMRECGGNRVSLGVQDFSKKVQEAVNRVQSYEMVSQILHQARELGYKSINFDLIYGLPFQTVSSINDTLEKTIELSPDRIAFYRLAMIPEMFKWQKSFGREHLPTEHDNIDIFLNAVNLLTAHGYEFIGLDHFAKKNEMLSASFQDRTLHRNFQGMTTGKALAIIAMGPSAVSQVPGYFWQNKKTTEEWLKQLETENFCFEKGLHLSLDDRLRQELIQDLYCFGHLDWKLLSEKTGIDCFSYFKEERESLNQFKDEGILNLSHQDSVILSPMLGRLLVRLVGSYFDPYFKKECEDPEKKRTRFSQLG